MKKKSNQDAFAKKGFNDQDTPDKMLIAVDEPTSTTYSYTMESLKDPAICSQLNMLTNCISELLYPSKLILKDIAMDFNDGYLMDCLIKILRSGSNQISIRPNTFIRNSHIARLESISEWLQKNADKDAFKERFESEWWNIHLILQNFLPSILIFLEVILHHFKIHIGLDQNITLSVLVQKQDIETQMCDQQNTAILCFRKKVQAQATSGHDCNDFEIAEKLLLDSNLADFEEFQKQMFTKYSTVLKKYSIVVKNIFKDFLTGTNFIIYLAHKKDFAVPFSHFHLIPSNQEQIIHNFKILFELLQIYEIDATPLSIGITVNDFVSPNNSVPMTFLHQKMSKI